MNKIAKKLRKLKDQLDKIEEKEDEILIEIDEAIEINENEKLTKIQNIAKDIAKKPKIFGISKRNFRNYKKTD